MADPHLLVDEPDELQHFGAPPLRHLEVEGAGDMHRLDVLDPGEGDVVVGPPPRDRHRHLVGLGAVEDPVAQRRQALDDVERVLGTIGLDLKLGHVDP